MNRLLPEDLAVFKKDHSDAVRFLLDAHKRFRENAALMKKRKDEGQIKKAQSMFTVIKRKDKK